MAGARNTTNPAERMLNLVALLSESSRPLTLEQIADKMVGQYSDKEEGRRTAFERDKKILRKLGIPITMQTLGGDDAGKTAYSIDRAEYKLIDFQLTSDELSALQEAAAVVQMGTRWGKRAVQWLGGEVVTEQVSAVALVDGSSQILPNLWEAVAQQKESQFVYHGKPRIVHPYGLISRNGFWYLICFDTARGAQAVYRVDRIEGAVTLGSSDSFVRPADFDLATAFPRDAKVFGDNSHEVAIVRVDRRAAPAVIRELGDEAVRATRADGSIDIEVPCGNKVAFRSWLYALVDRAHVISPATVRNEIISDLQRLAGGV